MQVRPYPRVVTKEQLEQLGCAEAGAVGRLTRRRPPCLADHVAGIRRDLHDLAVPVELAQGRGGIGILREQEAHGVRVSTKPACSHPRRELGCWVEQLAPDATGHGTHGATSSRRGPCGSCRGRGRRGRRGGPLGVCGLEAARQV